MSFGDVLWSIIVAAAFVGYLIIVFFIITDLIRDPDTSGWAKAAWAIFLFIFPLLTALVYFIARGSGMAERAHRADRTEAMQVAQLSQLSSGAGASAAEQIVHAKSLLDSGAITQQEYDTLKAKALAS